MAGALPKARFPAGPVPNPKRSFAPNFCTGPSEAQSSIDGRQECFPLLLGIHRIPIEIIPHAEIGEQPRRVLMKMKKGLRLSIEDTELLFPDPVLHPDLIEKL
jgi:hypothetical protein